MRFHSEKFAQSVSRTWLKFTIRRVSVNSIWGRLRERAKSYAKALANDILR
ncbi:hypothetical protein GQQ66_26175 [Klebsiella pneumoniae]|nr:hypothetical protein [Klebsiella pneumoniae]MBW5533702.1 hypothetical protein [Klebsiella pneumoniae]MBW5538765.1 hypothetical protein [Klebsiella pneumoniae]HBX0023489.1 hypothetical protein [Klebsiella pneumoniae]HBX0023771.1 hypothetical protein [Klebsiella pneumoniae]